MSPGAGIQSSAGSPTHIQNDLQPQQLLQQQQIRHQQQLLQQQRSGASPTPPPPVLTAAQQLKQLQELQAQQMQNPGPRKEPVDAFLTPSKLSIPAVPKTLEISTPAEPQMLKPSRPTLLSGSSIGTSILSTPAVSKIPAVDIMSMAGEPNVLGKRKLKDLVVSVTGPDSDMTIDGDVEEALCNVADEFIHNLTTFACRLAKRRKSEKLENRDIQLYLERNWNIRIPGYSADEVRSVRKIIPAASHNQKVAGVKMNKSVDSNVLE